ncbi:hypothetical protein LJC68_00290 [Bacteroidales bacterium OttesenSCG-928-B11]|nr:hypothetical protein [Bacteroidales bacterium OttesenSCG-928-B11]
MGRAVERYPSIARHYQITYLSNNEKPSEMRQVEWSVKDPAAIDKNSGVYFLHALPH